MSDSESKGKIYISGPMSGMLNNNREAFREAAKRFKKLGWEPLNPAATDKEAEEKTWLGFMRKDLRLLADADAIAMLPGWHNSNGAKVEHQLMVGLGLPVYDAETGELYHESVCHEGFRLVHGSRGQDYGHPIEDFTRTGIIWGAILGTAPVAPERVGLCMAGVKISRECNKPKRDNLADICGYAETVDMIKRRKAAENTP